MKAVAVSFLLIAGLASLSCDEEPIDESPTGPSVNPTATPSTATPRPAGNNRPPVITGVDQSPRNPILAGATNVSFGVFASDPDGDPMTFTWEFADGDADARGVDLRAVTRVFYRERQFPVKVTVTDGRGGSASATNDVNVVTLDGEWRVANARGFGIGATVSHSGGRSISGRFSDGSTFTGNVNDPFSVTVTISEGNDLCIRSGQYRGSTEWPNMNIVNFGGTQCRGFSWLR